MKAIVAERYGRPESPAVLELRTVDMPVLDDHQVLVRVHASSVNPAEWYEITGLVVARPSNGWLKPKRGRVGSDLAGRIEAVGKDVTEFQPGDEVFGSAPGSWAEYTAARGNRLVRKPPNVSFEEAGAVAIAALTALQALRDQGRVQSGQKVLVNGASGGVGTYAVQLAKWFGADVTAVCSTRNVDQAQTLGADRVVDYTKEDFTQLDERHDLMLDIAGRTPFSKFRRVLTPEANVVLVGGHMTYRGLGPLPHLGGTMLAMMGRSQKAKFFVAKITQEDLEVMRGLLESGTVKSVIDRSYELNETPAALAYLGEGHARGKIVITV
jgi:NADPH:quinone reductase-like Zn-dependent oxidoreductase